MLVQTAWLQHWDTGPCAPGGTCEEEANAGLLRQLAEGHHMAWTALCSARASAQHAEQQLRILRKSRDRHHQVDMGSGDVTADMGNGTSSSGTQVQMTHAGEITQAVGMRLQDNTTVAEESSDVCRLWSME